MNEQKFVCVVVPNHDEVGNFERDWRGDLLPIRAWAMFNNITGGPHGIQASPEIRAAIIEAVKPIMEITGPLSFSSEQLQSGKLAAVLELTLQAEEFYEGNGYTIPNPKHTGESEDENDLELVNGKMVIDGEKKLTITANLIHDHFVLTSTKRDPHNWIDIAPGEIKPEKVRNNGYQRTYKRPADEPNLAIAAAMEKAEKKGKRAKATSAN